MHVGNFEQAGVIHSTPEGSDIKRWEHFQHGADIGVRGSGTTLDSAFEQTAVALTAVITEPESVAPSTALTLHCEAPNPELLLVDWLNALVYEMANRRMLFSRFKVKLDGNELSAMVWGEEVDTGRHHPAVEVKGATYTELSVKQLESGVWIAQCVVDV